MPIASAIEPRRPSYQHDTSSREGRSLQDESNQSSLPSINESHELTQTKYITYHEKGSDDEFLDNDESSQDQYNIDVRRRQSTIARRRSTMNTLATLPPEDSFRGRLLYIRDKCGDIVEDERLQIFILLCIVVNSIMFGVATFPAIKDDPSNMQVFEVVDVMFLVIFTVELAMQLTCQGVLYFKDGWLVFDLLLVVISWLSLEVFILRAFRVFRALRLVTRVELLRNVVVALFSIVPAIVGITCLLLLIMYIFAVMFTQLFKDYYEQGITSVDYFGRMDLTFFTLFQIICLDEWSAIAYEIVAVDYWAWAIFISFVVVTAFVVMNLIIAVICEAVHVLRTAERAMLYGFDLDSDGDGMKNNDDGTDEDAVERRVREMTALLAQLEVSQQQMAKTIHFLSQALMQSESKEVEGGDPIYKANKNSQ
mmetsp:Transcript_5720/g.12690  ORF Transcript_5720/g.12690 Transcript_5720/m.12690 type:complete len:424 (+) Transcript_5720:133-1404(+)